MRHAVPEVARKPGGNEGSAFVISILVLFVLSVLGLALMLTTSTEKDIAINYRWGEQAFFNADAALEYGKNVLASYAVLSSDFEAILPLARADATVPDNTQPWGAALPGGGCNPMAPGCRDNQYFVDQCPQGGGGPCTRAYIGLVLTRLDGTQAMWDFRMPAAGIAGDLDNDGVADIDGTYTIWVRRPLVGTRDYGSLPNENDRVILTAEGTAPGTHAAGAGKPASLRRLEMSIRLPTAGIAPPCSQSDETGCKPGKGSGGPSPNMSEAGTAQ
jgi:hypothetical protein